MVDLQGCAGVANGSSNSTPTTLHQRLQAVVLSIQWTYSLFWQFSPSRGVLSWADGCYNGVIKTRKSVRQTEEAGGPAVDENVPLHRAQQLKDLYQSLLTEEEDLEPPRRSWATLSPEDLTESEWFFLMCISFSYPPGIGLPGRAFQTQGAVWLSGANGVDSKIFSRAILAKTVVCIPLSGGVLEIGTTDWRLRPLGVLQQQPAPGQQPFSGHHVDDGAESTYYSRACEESPVEDFEIPEETTMHNVAAVEKSGPPEDLSDCGGLLDDRRRSAFSPWSPREVPLLMQQGGSPQETLKLVLRTIPYLYGGWGDERSPKSTEGEDLLSGKHVLAERKRREKLNEKFLALRSLVPSGTKVDKASVLGDTVNYIKQLLRRMEEYEARIRQMESEKTTIAPNVFASDGGERTRNPKRRSEATGVTTRAGRKRPRASCNDGELVNGGSLHVSVIETDMLVEMKCQNVDGLLVRIMEVLEELRLDTISITSASADGNFKVEIRAKLWLESVPHVSLLILVSAIIKKTLQKI
ncbi:unnamed protein product [Spirodela intermedia]|uniref:BHLH domain-containing protein n=1 Tax=Spirodela intermedia TaxID=51605 RepID=A0A7I8J298_SPIIN|nr:unnamed protein product [Spirodela intermedia]CAA6663501.1 unnamed protein product [Spirodela intermedia]